MSNPTVYMEQAVIVVFASFGRDAQTLAEIIERTGAQAFVCRSGNELCSLFDDSTAAIVVTEESLREATDTILSCLTAQPAWSDVPVIILSGGHGRAGAPARWRLFRQFGNVTVLDRPLSGDALMIALEAACRARAWQYVVRDQMHKLEASNVDLEQKVRERTHALQLETDERKRIEGALNEARRLEAIGRLAGGIAHDFNNLLQVISGACEMLPHAGDNADRGERLIGTILRATERGSKLTQQLLAFGRRQVLSDNALDVARHLTEMKDLLRQSLREKNRLELRLQSDLWHVRADVTQLEVAMLNLMINAKDVLPAGGNVTLAAQNARLPTPDIPEIADLSGDFVWISVSDDGPGMPTEVAAQAFEPFFTTKRIGEGSGLGLSQVYGFAKQSGGAAWIRTSEHGTEVSILLPRGAAESPKAEQQDDAADGATRLRGLRILCVEDDEAVGEIAQAMLNAFGCKVDRAINADAALQANLQDYDLVFSDVLMPGSMDGIDMSRKIAERRPDLPILLASGYMVAPERLRELRVHAIAKPYTSDMLRTALLHCLGEADRGSTGRGPV
ncbi:response regulator [Noviherbaspirillum malthae]|uniref:response regulator n=1 Tax=Noviherbaspirillum malthae TaxID=1260987 RepID=UPI00188F24F2|nr:response regulator [Noviherbaspirillum malthae]